MNPYERARRTLIQGVGPTSEERTAEGGCGVIGLASTIPIAGEHIIGPVAQMRNRGNGKGGGVALCGCFPDYPRHYALNVGLLGDARQVVEGEFVEPYFDVAHAEEQPQLDDHRALPYLEVRPPQVLRYFVRVKPDVLSRFAERHGFENLEAAEDEFVYQNSFRLNRDLYADRGDDKLAFVLSHGRNMMILKAVGYAEDIARYYRLQEQTAHVWIGHQRYPTRGRVWHPGGAHPYPGMDEALVHNGDFANYRAVTTYLQQRGYVPLFLTDTEVAVLLFDLYKRVYDYPLEYVIEAMAPTTELDFVQLPLEKREIYAAIQAAHLHGSPDGPWFFIIARQDVSSGAHQLIGITDTSMLRPQVFALQEGFDQDGTPFGLAMVSSEKQAIDAALQSISHEHPQVCPVPDRVWVARGGSHEDGGAFIFNIGDSPDNGHKVLQCTDKFGREIATDRRKAHADYAITLTSPTSAPAVNFDGSVDDWLTGSQPDALFEGVISQSDAWTFRDLERWAEELVTAGSRSPAARRVAIETLTLLNDRRYPTARKKRSAVLAIVRRTLDALFMGIPGFASARKDGDTDRLLNWESRRALRPPSSEDARLYIDARGFPAEGGDSAARAVVAAYEVGWRRITVFACAGHRFLGSGLGPHSDGVLLDIYGSSGDYLGSGLDGAEIRVHGDAQDQVGQILARGKLVVYGNVGQTLLYGAKGGVCYVLGNAAGRPLINAVGNVRAVIHGTCLDYAAESFMAGPTTGGGFLCINGLTFDGDGRPIRLEQPYPGGNFFSLASGGAGYLNDPHRTLHQGQLNGAGLARFTEADWEVLLPHLEKGAALFGIPVEALITLDDEIRRPHEIYRKVVPVHRKLAELGA